MSDYLNNFLTQSIEREIIDLVYVTFGSVAIVETYLSRMAARKRKAGSFAPTDDRVGVTRRVS